MKKIVLSLLVLTLLVAGFWIYTGPQRALRDIKIAAEAGDVEGIREHVDIPSVKESLKEQLTALMQKKMETDTSLKDNPFAGLGMLFASKMVETMVDGAVTPTRLVSLIQGDRTKAFSKDDSPDGEAKHTEEITPEWSGNFNAVDRYTINILNKQTRKPAISLTMRRQGFSWKLTAIQLPIDEEPAKDAKQDGSF